MKMFKILFEVRFENNHYKLDDFLLTVDFELNPAVNSYPFLFPMKIGTDAVTYINTLYTAAAIAKSGLAKETTAT